MSDPEPTTVLIVPAAVPAARIPRALSGVMLHHCCCFGGPFAP